MAEYASKSTSNGVSVLVRGWASEAATAVAVQWLRLNSHDEVQAREEFICARRIP